MLIIFGLPTCHCGEALLMANWILNRVPYSKSNTTQHHLCLGYPDSLNNLKVWGCPSYVWIPDIRRPKLGPRANMCVFLGFTEDSDACKFLNLGTKFIIKTQDAEFLRINLLSIKTYHSKMYLKILKSLLYQMNQSLQKLKVLMLMKKLRKLQNHLPSVSESRKTLEITS